MLPREDYLMAGSQPNRQMHRIPALPAWWRDRPVNWDRLLCCNYEIRPAPAA